MDTEAPQEETRDDRWVSRLATTLGDELTGHSRPEKVDKVVNKVLRRFGIYRPGEAIETKGDPREADQVWPEGSPERGRIERNREIFGDRKAETMAGTNPWGALDEARTQLVERRDELNEIHGLLDGMGAPEGPEAFNRLAAWRSEHDMAESMSRPLPEWVTARIDRLEEQREEARGAEGLFKAQRDSALHLLRWLIGDLIPPDLVTIQGDEAPDEERADG